MSRRRLTLASTFVITVAAASLTACGPAPDAQAPESGSGDGSEEPISANPPGPDGEPGIGDGAGPPEDEPEEGEGGW